MKQYLPKLYKKINELGFKNHPGEFTKAVSEKTSKSEWNELKWRYESGGEIFYCVVDVLTINYPENCIQVFHSKVMKDVLFTLNDYRLLFENSLLPEEVEELMGIMSQFDTKLVGGCVRDMLIGREPKDFDFVTSAPYDIVAEELRKEGYTIKETGKQFLVMIASKNGYDSEIANFRKDGTYVDGRRPDSVEIGDIYEDAKRRDFTVNALYIDVRTLKLQDPTGLGIDDIQNRTLRFIGTPKDRLSEDWLRGIRFYRFVITKEFNPDPKSLRVVREMFGEIITKTSPERIRLEIERMSKLLI
jgi:hypothetical protein